MNIYKNLAAEIAREGITEKMLARGIGINVATMSAKINCEGRMKLYEAVKIRDCFFLEWLLTICFLPYRTERQRTKNAVNGGTEHDDARVHEAHRRDADLSGVQGH